MARERRESQEDNSEKSKIDTPNRFANISMQYFAQIHTPHSSVIQQQLSNNLSALQQRDAEELSNGLNSTRSTQGEPISPSRHFFTGSSNGIADARMSTDTNDTAAIDLGFTPENIANNGLFAKNEAVQANAPREENQPANQQVEYVDLERAPNLFAGLLNNQGILNSRINTSNNQNVSSASYSVPVNDTSPPPLLKR